MNIPKNIYHINGSKSGPVVTILGGTHGDELIGVEVIKKILELFKLNTIEHGMTHANKTLVGELYFGFGNPEAIKKRTRAAEDGPDLNRSFHMLELGAEVSKNDRYDLHRARELMPLFKNTDYLIDLHCTTKKSVPFVCFGDDSKEHRRIYSKIPVEYILTDPNRILPKDVGKVELGTTDHAVNMYGGSLWSIKKYGYKKGIGMCYETGQKNDTKEADAVFEVILGLLEEIGVFKSGFVRSVKTSIEMKQQVYSLTEIIKAKEKEFLFEPHLSTGFAPVKRGEKIGYYPRTGEHEYAPCGGRLVFQKSVQNQGASNSLCYVARKIIK